MADHAVSAPISSEIPLWEKWAEQDTELRVLAQNIWHDAQRLKISTGYSGVAEMIAIEEKLPLKVKVNIQVLRRNALETLATKLAPASAGHNRDILDGSGQGSHQQIFCS